MRWPRFRSATSDRSRPPRNNESFVIPGRCEASNPESRDSGSGPSDHPGMTDQANNNNQGKAPMNDIVLQKLDQGLLTITMNRPDRRNALNPEMTLGLVEAARRAAEDHEVRAVLLKGAGGTFCVGGAWKSM